MAEGCLIVEDNDLIREILEEYIERLDLPYRSVRNGIEAMDACNDYIPSCIILDWHMPNMDGVEFLTRLRKMEGGNRPHIIFCSCDDLSGHRSMLKEFGISAYIIKPVKFNDIEDVMKRLNVL
ncbi:response regulator [Rickettsiales bacterium]|nr:response regulator [Rickettsiales bacterium]